MGKLLDKLLHSKKQPAENDGIKSFKEQQQKDEAFSGRDMGIQTVPLDQIVGSVGRYQDFDSRFRLKRALPSDRLRKIKSLMLQGKVLPPVKLYQIKDEYYVLDGNHRVAATKEFGHDSIDAHIVEFLPSKNNLENLLYREKVEFKSKTGLKEPVELTEIGQYSYLVKQISEHHGFLKTTGAERVSFQDAATDWYKTIYRPLAGIIKKSHLPETFSKRTVADLFAYISFHQWEKGRKRTYGIGIDQLIPKNMEAFRGKMANIKEIELPEMKHWISAFVLVSVRAGKDYRVMERLFEMSEIREVHAIHGEFDILAKIVMERDLLSSDSEIIGQIIHEKVRRIQDVEKTQTLIPAASKQK